MRKRIVCALSDSAEHEESAGSCGALTRPRERASDKAETKFSPASSTEVKAETFPPHLYQDGKVIATLTCGSDTDLLVALHSLIQSKRIRLHLIPDGLPSPESITPQPLIDGTAHAISVAVPFRVELLPLLFRSQSEVSTSAHLSALPTLIDRTASLAKDNLPAQNPSDKASPQRCYPRASGNSFKSDSDVRDHVSQITCPTEWKLEVSDPEGLQTCHLLPYQRRALAWMWWRETGTVHRDKEGKAQSISLVPEAFTDATILSVVCKTASVDFTETRTGSLTPGEVHFDVRNDWRIRTSAPAPLRRLKGGLLADEMGLGKTIECIGLILLHRPGHGFQFGTADQAGLIRGPTLIVTPPNLVQQWVGELNQRAPGLSVVVYDGLKEYELECKRAQRKKKHSGAAPYDVEDEIPPNPMDTLTGCDVVISTYGVLAHEAEYVPHERSLRHKKRYQVPHTPLLQIHWWRMVLDEAQMVGGINLSVTGRMARKIITQHRWLVTGTPIGAGGVNDISGQLQALCIDPFEDTKIFREIVKTEGLHCLGKILKPIMWRNNKQSTAGDHTLTSRKLQHVTLEMSPLESSIYTSILKATLRLTSFWKALSRELQSHEGVLSVEEVLSRLRDQNQLNLQSAERDYCSAANALAACIANRLGVLQGPLSEDADVGPKLKGPIVEDIDVGPKLKVPLAKDTDTDVGSKRKAGAPENGDASDSQPAQKKSRKQKKGVSFAQDVVTEDEAGVGPSSCAANSGGDGDKEPVQASTPAQGGSKVQQQHLRELLMCLEKSNKVGDKGIRSLLNKEEMEQVDFNDINESIVTHAASLLHWRYVEKMGDITYAADQQVRKAMRKLDQRRLTISSGLSETTAMWELAKLHGLQSTLLPLKHSKNGPQTWIEEVGTCLEAAKAVEANKREHRPVSTRGDFSENMLATFSGRTPSSN
eukprot:gene12660-15894_t